MPRKSSHSRRERSRGEQSGITLIELLVAVAIIALMTAIAYPSLTAGLDGIRLRTDIDRAGAFFNEARLRSDLRQQPVQLTVDPKKNRLEALTVDGRWQETLVFDPRVRILAPKEAQSFMLYPATPPPGFRLMLGSEQGGRAGLKVNVFTGTPEEWKVPAAR